MVTAIFYLLELGKIQKRSVLFEREERFSIGEIQEKLRYIKR